MIEPQLAFAVDLGFLGMHIEAEGASVNLGGANIDQIQDRLLDRNFLDFVAQSHQAFEELGRKLCEVKSLCHLLLPRVGI